MNNNPKALKAGNPRLPGKKAECDVFVKEFLSHGDHIQAYRKAFPTRKNFKDCAPRVLRNPLIQKRIREISQQADEIFAQDLANEKKLLFLTYAEKRDLLRRIALGEEKVKKNMQVNGKWELMDMPADMDDRLRAIDIENRMTGDYSAEKIEMDQKLKGFIININGNGWTKTL